MVLRLDESPIVLFGGKGGVGKTTCACAAAVHLASRGKKTLLISTDPAHSLGDSLGQRLGDEMTQITALPCLSALELNAAKSLREFKEENEEEILSLLRTGSYLDDADLAELLSLSIPGLDEVMGFKRITDLLATTGADHVLIDTAPTGHALRLLMVPELADQWVKVLASLRWKYRQMVTQLVGGVAAERSDDFLLDLKRSVKRMRAWLRDRRRTQFVVVTIPEYLAVRETQHLVEELRAAHVPLRHLIINHVRAGGTIPCPFCAEVRWAQQPYIAALRAAYADLEVTLMTQEPREVRGLEALRCVARQLFGRLDPRGLSERLLHSPAG